MLKETTLFCTTQWPWTDTMRICTSPIISDPLGIIENTCVVQKQIKDKLYVEHPKHGGSLESSANFHKSKQYVDFTMASFSFDKSSCKDGQRFLITVGNYFWEFSKPCGSKPGVGFKAAR